MAPLSNRGQDICLILAPTNAPAAADMQNSVAGQRRCVGDTLPAALYEPAIGHQGDRYGLGHSFFAANVVEVTKREASEPLDGGEQVTKSVLPRESSLAS